MMRALVALLVVLAAASGVAHAASDCDRLMRSPEYQGGLAPEQVEELILLAKLCQLRFVTAAAAVQEQKFEIAKEMEQDIKSPALQRLLNGAIRREAHYRQLADEARDRAAAILKYSRDHPPRPSVRPKLLM